MQRDEELAALEKLKDELGSKGYKLELLLEQNLDQLDPIDALEKLRDVQVSQDMEEQISTLESKGYKLYKERANDMISDEENKIIMELSKLRQTLTNLKMNKLKMEAADNLKRFEQVKSKIKVLRDPDNVPIANVALPGLKLRF